MSSVNQRAKARTAALKLPKLAQTAEQKSEVVYLDGLCKVYEDTMQYDQSENARLRSELRFTKQILTVTRERMHRERTVSTVCAVLTFAYIAVDVCFHAGWL